MDWLNSGWGVAILSAIVSAVITLTFRWWDRTAVKWVPVGEAHTPYGDSGKITGTTRFTLTLHNAGNGTAYDVRTTRRKEARFKPQEFFDAATVLPGADIQFSTDTGVWAELTIALSWSAPGRLGRLGRSHVEFMPAEWWADDGDTSGSRGARPRLPDSGPSVLAPVEPRRLIRGMIARLGRRGSNQS